MAEEIVPITGRQLVLPDGPIFHLQRADAADYELGAFRQWAGYKDLGVDDATDGLVLLQHVLSFGPSSEGGRTGVHCHMAHVHIVIPTSGRGVFSYDGVITEAVPGGVIVQHGGTVHDQFEYSYASATAEENRKTSLSVEPAAPGAPMLSFGFLELFVPRTIADVEIIPPDQVTDADQASAWNHPYHPDGASFALQTADAPDAGYRPVVGRPDLKARDAGTWGPSGELVATWIIQAAADAAAGPGVSLGIAEEEGGLDILFMMTGSASFQRSGAEPLFLRAGDTLTATQGMVGDPVEPSADMRLIRFFVSSRAQALRERTPEEIERLEALGARIITGREVRTEGDAGPINVLHTSPAGDLGATAAI